MNTRDLSVAETLQLRTARDSAPTLGLHSLPTKELPFRSSEGDSG